MSSEYYVIAKHDVHVLGICLAACFFLFFARYDSQRNMGAELPVFRICDPNRVRAKHIPFWHVFCAHTGVGENFELGGIQP